MIHMASYTVVYNKWWDLGTFSCLEEAEEFAKKMEKDRDIFEYHWQHDISGNVSDLIDVCDTT